MAHSTAGSERPNRSPKVESDSLAFQTAGRANQRAVVLLVEDDPNDQFLTQEAFKAVRRPCDLRIVPDGQEALEYLRHEGKFQGGQDAPRPDLILLDLNMPRMTGQQAAAAIQADSSLADIPIIVLTMSLRQEDILRAYGRGVISYIRKPLGLAQFTDVVVEIDGFLGSIVSIKRLRSGPRLTERQLVRVAELQRQFEQRAEDVFNQYMGELIQPSRNRSGSETRVQEAAGRESLLRLAQRILDAPSLPGSDPARGGSPSKIEIERAQDGRGPEPDIASLSRLAKKLTTGATAGAGPAQPEFADRRHDRQQRTGVAASPSKRASWRRRPAE